ncbi:hypothetical protein ABW19_dt0204103 [Dactylella cylindrospora]|nr:hypothetical protein ABW19_dt0204103 [Dactylella cylindrospora]
MCAMMMGKANQNAGATVIYPFLGFESSFLGTLDCEFDGIAGGFGEFYLESRDLRLVGRHRVCSHRGYMEEQFGTDPRRVGAPDAFSFENWWRYYPVVNIQMWEGERRALSFVAFLIGSMVPTDESLRLAVSLGVQQAVATYYGKGMRYERYPVAVRAAGVLARDEGDVTAGNGYIPGVCLRCAYNLYDEPEVKVRKESRGTGSLYCIHGSGADMLELSDSIHGVIRYSEGVGGWRFAVRKLGKGHLTGKLKQHFAIVDLGSSLGNGCGLPTSLGQYNRSMGKSKSPIIDFRKGVTKDKTFTIPPGFDSFFTPQGKPSKNPKEICWNYGFTTTDCPHTRSEDWSITPFYKDAFPVRDLVDWTRTARANDTFLPDGAVLAGCTQDLADAKGAGKIPIVCAMRRWDIV